MKKISIGLLLAILAMDCFAADAALRKFISKGMTEGEVMSKIGRPDNESETSGGGAKVVEKVWSYFPTDGDKQILTTIIVKDGRVTSVDRSISR